MNAIGIMQGRLLPPEGGRIQSFPVAGWREEFARARQAGLDCIEWIYETGTDLANPLIADEGIAEIRRLADASGVGVKSICADYFMGERLIGEGGTIRRAAVAHLERLIGRARTLGVRYMVLPFVDSSSLATEAEVEALVGILREFIPLAEQTQVELHLETDLSPEQLGAVLDRVGHPLVLMNYDIGNRASLGFDPTEELTLLKGQLGSVHVKDRVQGGGTVPLGTGAADFPTCFQLIVAAGFGGPFILQAARGPDGNEVELAREQRTFVERHLKARVLPGR